MFMGTCLLAEENWKEGRRPLRIGIGTSWTALGSRLLLRGRVDWTGIAGRRGGRFRRRAGVIRRRRRGRHIGTRRLGLERTAARPTEIVGPPAWSRHLLALAQDARD